MMEGAVGNDSGNNEGCVEGGGGVYGQNNTNVGQMLEVLSTYS